MARGSFPFYCKSSFGGTATIGPKEVEGSEQSIASGEIWCPLWKRPSTLSEVQRIFGEGRLQIGDRTCSRSLDFALAVKGLGLDRGVDAFYRYSLLERSGSGRQTTLLAVPSGCFVPERSADLSLLKELREFSESVATYITDGGQQPRRVTWARVEYERAWYDATTSAVSNRQEVQAGVILSLLVSTGRLMRELGANRGSPGMIKVKRGQKTSEQQILPVGQLSRKWTDIIGRSANSSEFRIARAVAGVASWGESPDSDKPHTSVESVRANLLPVSRRGRGWIWDATAHSAVWARGGSLESNLAAVMRRRLIDGKSGAGDGLPLWSSSGARLDDILLLWRGEVDEQRLSDLIYALSLVDAGPSNHAAIEQQQATEVTPDLQTSAVWFGPDEQAHVSRSPVRLDGWTIVDSELRAAFELPRVYHLLKLCFVGGRLPRRPVAGLPARRSGTEPFPPDCLDVLTLVEAGRLSEAAILAARRLRVKGYPSILRDADLRELQMDATQCRRMAGLLLIPLEHPSILAAVAIKPETTI